MHIVASIWLCYGLQIGEAKLLTPIALGFALGLNWLAKPAVAAKRAMSVSNHGSAVCAVSVQLSSVEVKRWNQSR